MHFLQYLYGIQILKRLWNWDLNFLNFVPSNTHPAATTCSMWIKTNTILCLLSKVTKDISLLMIHLDKAIPWNVLRLIWIGWLKHTPEECLIARIPKELLL